VKALHDNGLPSLAYIRLNIASHLEDDVRSYGRSPMDSGGHVALKGSRILESQRATIMPGSPEGRDVENKK